MTDAERTTLEAIFSEAIVALEANREKPNPHKRPEGEEFTWEDNLLHLHRVTHEMAYLPIDLAYDSSPYSDILDVVTALLEWLLGLRTMPDLFETKSSDVIH